MNSPSVQPAHDAVKLPVTPASLTFYPNPYQVDCGEHVEISLQELFETGLERGPKSTLPYVAAHKLKPGGVRRGPSIDTVGPVLLLDSDVWTAAHEEQLSRMPGQWVLHPSPSGKPGRVRIWLVLSRAVTPVEYRTLYKILNAWLLHGLDRQCSSPVQGYYFGTEVDEPFRWRSYGAMPLDVDALDLADATPPMPAPTRAELAEWDDDWRSKQAQEIVATFPAAARGERHGALFRVAQTCRDWGVSLAATREIVRSWNFALCSPPEDEDEIDSKVLINLDQYRRHPVGCALAVAVKVHRDHTRTLDRVTRVLLHRCDNLYVRDGTLVETVPHAEGLTIRELSTDRLNELISSNVTLLRWEKPGKEKPGGWIRCDAVPVWVPRELYARPTHVLRELKGITPMPCLRRDGTVMDTEGYDPREKVYLQVGEDVPHSPPRVLAEESCERVMGMFSQFPMDDVGRATILSYLLAAVGRHHIDGPVPVLILDANRPQVGKSKIAETISIVAAGYRVASRGWEGERNRMLDTLHSAIVTEPRVVFFDNVDNGGLLASGVLDGALTHGKIARRQHYSHHQMELTFRPLVLVTGNGVRVGADLAPRACHVRLQTTLEDPALRDDLKIPNLLEHVQASLPQITSDLLTMWRGWFTAGAPVPPGSKPWATFQAWNAVRWVTMWLGWEDPLLARRGATERDIDTEALELLLRWIYTKWPDGVSATVLASSVSHRPMAGAPETDDAEDRAELGGKLKVLCGGEVNAHLLGIQLGRFADRPLGGRMLVRHRPGGKVRWAVERIAG